ncbi:MAG: hypothetical protein ACR2J8_04545, partial [Thermomicrobiales bacterium]
LTHEPLVLVGGVPLETRQKRPGVLEASIPPELFRKPARLPVEVISGGGVSAPVWLRVRRR